MEVLLDDSDLVVASIRKEVPSLTFEDLCSKAQEAVRFVGSGVFFERGNREKYKIIYPSK